MNNVVVTGLGVVSPLGYDINSFWTACLDNQSNIESIPEQWNNYSEYRSGIWSPLPQIDFTSYGFSRLEVMQRDPVSLLAMMATHQALEHAGIGTSCVNEKNHQYALQGLKSSRVGVFIGTGIGGAKTFLENHAFHMLNRTKKQLIADAVDTNVTDKLLHPSRVNPFVVSMLMPNSVSASIGIKFSLHDLNQTISQACSSGTSAIGYAYQAIQSGLIDVAICGGSEYLYDDYGGIYRGFDIARTLVQPRGKPNAANRPFDKARSGFLYSQGGAGILILERESVASERDANVLSHVKGFAETFDAYSMMSLSSEGAEIKRMIRLALRNANLTLKDIDYINAHGTGTKINDRIESMILDELFGEKPIINSSKSLLGHGIGASGALEAIISVLSLRDQTTHQCKNLENPIRDLNFVRTVEKQHIKHVLTQSFAFGGHNSGLVLAAP